MSSTNQFERKSTLLFTRVFSLYYYRKNANRPLNQSELTLKARESHLM